MLFMLITVLSTLDGASDGVDFYIGQFDTAQLASFEMWATACGQILFSLSPGMGTAVTLSSFTKPKEDVFRVCMIVAAGIPPQRGVVMLVAVSNSCFSITGGFAIFGILGSLAKRNGVTVAALAANSGPGLAFIAIADGIQARCERGAGPAANVMSVLFFLMLLSLGLDSTFAWAETFCAFIEETLAVKKIHPPGGTKTVIGCMCVVFFLGGLPYCTRMGIQLLDVVDHYAVAYCLLMSCFFESFMLRMDYTWERMVYAVKSATRGNDATPQGRGSDNPPAWGQQSAWGRQGCS
eukprot:gene2479-20706_t